MKKDSSFVVVEKETGKALFETFQDIRNVINTEKYEAIPIYDYLTALNEKIKNSHLTK